MSQSESQAHKDLKRLALLWAQAQGYRAAAAEVSLPNYRFRLDVAAYRPHKVRSSRYDDRLKKERVVWEAAIGQTAVFECKASRIDYKRDARSMQKTMERLEVLHERKARIEQELHLHYPSIFNGDSLFQEYQTVDFTRPGHERYQLTLRDIGLLTSQLLENTKFDRLVKWGAANLFYVVAEPGIVAVHELPVGWGLLIREGEELISATKPVLHEIAQPERLSLLHQIAQASTRTLIAKGRMQCVQQSATPAQDLVRECDDESIGTDVRMPD